MYEETFAIDIERLRDDLRDECLSAYYGGGFGVALMESFDVDGASENQLIEMARSRGIDLRNYRV